jgi:mRNA interferase YafO
MSSVKVSKEIKKFSEHEKLVQGFHQHIKGNTPVFLGRDVAYDHYNTSPIVKRFLRHIHICVPLNEAPSRWAKIADIFRRTNNKDNPDKDFALIYCYNDLTDTYYLLTIIGPDAHNYNRWMGFLRDTAIQAERLVTGCK